MRGCCTKPKMRSAYDQQPKNPTTTPMAEKMIRFLSSSRWAMRGIECACVASTETAASATSNLRLPDGQVMRGLLAEPWEFITACKIESYDAHYGESHK